MCTQKDILGHHLQVIGLLIEGEPHKQSCEQYSVATVP